MNVGGSADVSQTHNVKAAGGSAAGGAADVGQAHKVQTVADSLKLSGHAQVHVVRHWDHILEKVESLYKDGHYGAAVIVAQTACEVVMARAMTKAPATGAAPRNAARTKAAPKKAAKVKSYRSYSPSAAGVRMRYDTLTGDTLDQHPFWQAYSDMAEHRHAAIHAGVDVPQQHARKDIDAAKQLINHIVQHNGLA